MTQTITPELARELLAKITPGEWEASQAIQGYRAPCEYGAQDMQILSQEGLSVGIVWHGIHDEETAATANLIALAPALARAYIAQAEELERLRADKHRLDFMDACNVRLNERYETTYGWKFHFNHNRVRLGLDGQRFAGWDEFALVDSNFPAKNIRAAIDEGMKEFKGVAQSCVALPPTPSEG